MPTEPRDLAQIRFENAMALFDDFVRATVKHPDAAALRGLDGRFAERLLIQPSYWSQIKARSRQIGERLARQFEQRCHKPAGWLDEPHGPAGRAAPDDAPAGDDERFIVGLVLSYYRRHPERARARLLDLLGEALQAPSAPPAAAPGAAAAGSDSQLWSKAAAAVAPLKRKR
ncbi:MAG: hypothetical protein ACXWCO_06205 [Caldimonas sp.]